MSAYRLVGWLLVLWMPLAAADEVCITLPNDNLEKYVARMCLVISCTQDTLEGRLREILNATLPIVSRGAVGSLAEAQATVRHLPQAPWASWPCPQLDVSLPYHCDGATPHALTARPTDHPE